MKKTVLSLLLFMPLFLFASWGGSMDADLGEGIAMLILTPIFLLIVLVILIVLIIFLPIAIPALLFYTIYIYIVFYTFVSLIAIGLALIFGLIIVIIAVSHYMKWLKIRNFFIYLIYFPIFIGILIFSIEYLLDFIRSGL